MTTTKLETVNPVAHSTEWMGQLADVTIGDLVTRIINGESYLSLSDQLACMIEAYNRANW